MEVMLSAASPKILMFVFIRSVSDRRQISHLFYISGFRNKYVKIWKLKKNNADRIFEIMCLLHIPSQEKSAPRGAVTVQNMFLFLFLHVKLIDFNLYF